GAATEADPSCFGISSGRGNRSMQITGFLPSTKLKNGKSGLVTTSNSISTATITGTDLKSGKDVTVIDPPGSSTPTYEWIGKTSHVNKDGTQCNVVLRQVMAAAGAEGKKCPEEDPTVISVTVGSTPMTPNPSVFIGPPALLGAGNYTGKWGGTGGGDFVWLVAVNTPSVNLANQSDQPQQWLVVAAVGAPPGSYTIQNVGNSQYLNWSPLGVSLVGILGPGT